MIRMPFCAVFLVIGLIVTGSPLGYTQQAASTQIAGGRGGSPFSDGQDLRGARIAEIRVKAGDTVDSIQAVYLLPDGRLVEGVRHGGRGGNLNVLRLESDEYIVGLSGRHGDSIDSLRIHTNRRTSPLYGGRGGDRDFRIEAPAGNQAVGFLGRSGDLVDAIGLIFAPLQQLQEGQTTLAGGRGGSPFSDAQGSRGGRIAEVRVKAGDTIDSIQAVYMLPDGRLIDGERRGGRGGNLSVFRLESDEYLVGLSGRYGDTIDSLRIHTNRRTSPLYGGRGGDRDFQIEVPAGSQGTGFTGRAGDRIDAIGLTYAGSGSSGLNAPSRRGRRLPDRRPQN